MTTHTSYKVANRQGKIDILKGFYKNNLDAGTAVEYINRMVSKNCGRLNKMMNCHKASEKLLIDGIVAFYCLTDDDIKKYLEVDPYGQTILEYEGMHYYIDMSNVNGVNSVTGSYKFSYSSPSTKAPNDTFVLKYNDDETIGGFSFLDEMYTDNLDDDDILYTSIINRISDLLMSVRPIWALVVE